MRRKQAHTKMSIRKREVIRALRLQSLRCTTQGDLEKTCRCICRCALHAPTRHTQTHTYTRIRTHTHTVGRACSTTVHARPKVRARQYSLRQYSLDSLSRENDPLWQILKICTLGVFCCQRNTCCHRNTFEAALTLNPKPDVDSGGAAAAPSTLWRRRRALNTTPSTA